MKTLYFITFAALVLLLSSCKQEAFQHEEQNPMEYSKQVSISDLVYLFQLDANKPFAQPLYIEATVNGVDLDAIHIQDNSDFALKVTVDNPQDYSIGSLARVLVGGGILRQDNLHYVISNPISVSTVGSGFSTSLSATIADLNSDIGKFTSKVVEVSDLQFTEIKDESHVLSYRIKQETPSAVNFWVTIPKVLNYDMPMAISSAKGYVSYENGNIYINVRSLDDVKEVYVEPTMIEKIINNSSLVTSVIQASEREIAPGVKMGEIAYMNNATPAPLLVSCTIFEIDLNNPKVKLEPGNPNNAAPPYNSIQNLATMAGHKNDSYASTDWRVLAAITGDFYVTSSNPTTYILNGPLVVNGNILKSDFYGTSDQFFGILKNNAGFAIGGRNEFETVKNNLEQAGGGRVILQNGQNVSNTAAREPRSAVGYSTNNRVYLFVGNGRNLSVSNGFSPSEIADLLKALGCEGAVYGNGGGATLGVLEDPNSGTYNVFTVSHATNPNHNPGLASSWMIVTERD